MTVAEVRRILIPLVDLEHDEAVDYIAIRQDGADFYCTVKLENGKKVYYKVTREITITPTNSKWKTKS